MPSFAVIGLAGGLTIPLTATVLGVMPTSQAGVASAVFNASREVAGLLGITVIGAVLTSRQGTSLAAGHTPVDAFLDGYRSGLLLAGALVMAGGVTAFAALRRAHRTAQTEATRDDLVLAG
jgi:Na+-transporting NADH:ubiquinone oxidoreductase subunit NqrD